MSSLSRYVWQSRKQLHYTCEDKEQQQCRQLVNTKAFLKYKKKRGAAAPSALPLDLPLFVIENL